ncbi:hypothetical protein EMIHUDRAFT_253492 [Emiliania huxleyi CCMP1516]|uniref:Mediator of RNA polymerase II transcription subunit 6 n=2 Tax=Emiliania huxleyi TaxID=2903 RepID=A0A0D3K777_EMIH1|nr:hypothetical protein EMIHUDRAFT_253492 [Emiliania huxleyi CCMP1516]EOD31612.1 hypothetical protein EMIHUDRAFT_253492 [Emiliania huxleyi CCMP1516]|eukprot:XP_005784041.1 hypothetical protein EMIHUDRAFT_253492 [Emiliania huxleyi CCMP1516]
MEQAPLTRVSWQDLEWLRHFPLNRDTVLDYFANSQARVFYDRTCLNEQLNMQQGLSREERAEMLEQMSGIELLRRHTCLSIAIAAVPACGRYALAKAQEAPTLNSVLRSRLLRLSWLLESAFEAVRGVTAPQRAGGDAGPKGGGATAMDVGS